jgi:uncharacterized lipoprotein YehR (DUF1307 family)
MKRILASVLVLSVMSIGLVGCGDKAKTEKKTTVETPGGTTEKTQSTETKTTGDNPPAAPK